MLMLKKAGKCRLCAHPCVLVFALGLGVLQRTEVLLVGVFGVCLNNVIKKRNTIE